MVSFKILSAAAALLLATPAMAVYRVNSPVQGTVWLAGDTVTISWYDDNSPAVAAGTPIELSLYAGSDPNDMKKLTAIGSASGSTGTLSYVVPQDYNAGSIFSVSIEYSGVQNFSHYFTVTGGRDNAVTSSSAIESESATASASASETESDSATDSASATKSASHTSASSATSSAVSSKATSASHSATSSVVSTRSSSVASRSTQSADDAESTDDSSAASKSAVTLGAIAITALSFSLLSRY
ncbi:hypothetical protein H4R33_003226 [Dimargaris cristalligena]|nr:hypothetical protein H4R33_003226 [Dimargaris cristalligena]